MKSTIIPPEPDVALKETSPATRLIHESLEVGTLAAKDYFGKLERDVNPYLAADLVRYHAALHIDQKQSKIQGFRREELPNNGLYVRFETSEMIYEIRIRKTGEDGTPDPGPSRTMQAFYQQKITGWDDVFDEDEPAHVNLLVVWEATKNYVLRGMTLLCPKDGSEGRGSAKVHWEVSIPHPASTLRPAQPRPEEPAAEPAADEMDDDLPLTRKRPPQTGTENSDD